MNPEENKIYKTKAGVQSLLKKQEPPNNSFFTYSNGKWNNINKQQMFDLQKKGTRSAWLSPEDVKGITTTNRPTYTGNTSPYQQAQADLVKRPTAPSEADLYQQQLDRAKALIEATKGQYLSDLQNLQQQGQARLNQTSSMAVGAGLAGSPFQQTQETQTQNYNNQILQQRKNERQAQISDIMNNASDEAEKRYQARRKTFESDRDAYLGYLKDNQDTARSVITNMAKSGLSIDEMDKDQYKKLLEDSGLSDLEARALYDSNSPKPTTSYQVSGSRIITISKNPITGEITTNSEEIPGLTNAKDGTYTTKISGNNLLLIPDNVTSSDDIIVKPLGSQTPITKTIGKTLYQYNPETSKWDIVAQQPYVGSGSSSDDKMIKQVNDEAKSLIQEMNDAKKGNGDMTFQQAWNIMHNKYPELKNETINNLLEGGIPYNKGVWDTSRAWGRAKLPPEKTTNK